jgi:hypothetical protein
MSLQLANKRLIRLPAVPFLGRVFHAAGLNPLDMVIELYGEACVSFARSQAIVIVDASTYSKVQE